MTIRGVDVAVSASIGVAICPSEATDVEELLRLADDRMFADKRRQHAQASPTAP